MCRWTEARSLGAFAVAALGACTRPAPSPAQASDANASASSDGSVVEMQLPAELTSASLELSGIAWAPALSRYLLVSDDVVHDGKKHAPVLFAAAPGGLLDPTPLPIEGIDELNDPESICAGPDGTFFVATSHSVNAHGHLPASRRRLLHLSLAPERSLRVLGQVDLTEAKGSDGEPPWPRDARLDIEAITFHEGALFIGLKSPLGPEREATILKLDRPVDVLRSRTVPAGAISRWARVRLCPTSPTVCEGIADMTFLRDGSLLLVANSPKGAPSDGGGALWRLGDKGAQPTLLKQFAGLRPEGITLDADGSRAIIVFDRGGKPPMWTTWGVSQ